MSRFRRPAAALLALVTFWPAFALGQAPRAGVVTTLEGNVTVTRVALPQPLPLKFKDDVFVNDRVTTGDKAIARMLLGGKAVVTVRERSSLTITEVPGKSTIELDSGKIALAVARDKMKPGESIEIRTPNVVAGVRGTVVVAEVSRATAQVGGATPTLVTTFYVLRGQVEALQINAVTGQPVGAPVPVGTLQQFRAAGFAPGTVTNIPPAQVAQIVGGLSSSKPQHTRGAGDDAAKNTAVTETVNLTNVITGGTPLGTPPSPPIPPIPVIPPQPPILPGNKSSALLEVPPPTTFFVPYQFDITTTYISGSFCGGVGGCTTDDSGLLRVSNSGLSTFAGTLSLTGTARDPSYSGHVNATITTTLLPSASLTFLGGFDGSDSRGYNCPAPTGVCNGMLFSMAGTVSLGSTSKSLSLSVDDKDIHSGATSQLWGDAYVLQGGGADGSDTGAEQTQAPGNYSFIGAVDGPTSFFSIGNGAVISQTKTAPLLQLDGVVFATSGYFYEQYGGSRVSLAGPLLITTNSALNLDLGLVGIHEHSQLIVTSTDPLVSVTGGTHAIASVPGAAMFDLKGTATAADLETGLVVGVDTPLQTGGALLELSGATVSGQKVLNVDTALLEASAPVLRLLNGAALTTSTHAIDLASKANVSLPGDALVSLNGSSLLVRQGYLVNVAGGSRLVVGDLVALSGGSTLSLLNGALLNVSGGSIVSVGGALVRFTGTGNLVSVTNSFVPTALIGGVPVYAPGGGFSVTTSNALAGLGTSGAIKINGVTLTPTTSLSSLTGSLVVVQSGSVKIGP